MSRWRRRYSFDLPPSVNAEIRAEQRIRSYDGPRPCGTPNLLQQMGGFWMLLMEEGRKRAPEAAVAGGGLIEQQLLRLAR